MTWKTNALIMADSNDREVWLEARRLGLGASDTPGVLGVSPFSSPVSVAADKLGLVGPREDSEIMAAGRRIESFIGEWALEEMEKGGSPAGMLLQSIKYPWLLATPDWWVVEKDSHGTKYEVPLQIKNSMRDWGEEIPAHVMVQVQQEQIVCAAPFSYVAVLYTGNRLRWAKVDRDHDLQAQIIQDTKAFWQKIEKREPIEADAHDATTQTLKELHPDDDGTTVPLTMELLESVAELDDVKAQVRTLNATKKGIENRIRQAIGDSTFGTFPDGSGYSLKTETREEHTVKASKRRTLRRVKAKGGR